MGKKRCNYTGCYNTSLDSVLFPYPVEDWKRFNLWLLHSGNLTSARASEFSDKYICCDHFHVTQLKRDLFGALGLVDGAVPSLYVNYGSLLDEEGDIPLNKPTKVYPKRNVKSFAINGNLTQRETKLNAAVNLNMHLTETTPKENEREKVSVYTIDANGKLTDTRNNKVGNKNRDGHIPNSTVIKIKEEPVEEIQYNDDEIDNTQELDKTIKVEADMQIKIEPQGAVDIKLENNSEPNIYLGKPSSEGSNPAGYNPESSDVERVHSEEVDIKVEQSTDDVDVSDVLQKETNVKANAVVDIKRECNMCNDPEVECGDPGVECGDPGVECGDPGVECISESIECDSAVVGCNSDTLNGEAQAVELTNDVDKQTGAARWRCACGARYRYKHDLQRHRVARHGHGAQKYPQRIFKAAPDGPEELSCALCKALFLQECDLHKHTAERHGAKHKPFQCDLCLERYKYEFMLIAHKKEHSGADFHCDLCGRECKTKRGLAKHLNSHTNERVFSCPTCGHTFTERTHLLNHLIKHTPDETFTCTSCDQTFDSATALKSHSSIHRTYFACKVCEEKFPEESGLGEHMKVHTKFLECTFCLKQFKDVAELQRHTNTHQDMMEKVQGSSHACPACGKRFLYRSVLRAHARVHSGERPFACAECPKRFKTSSARNEHARGHRMLHKCLDCGKSFARPATLGRHRRLHTGERPYFCHLCDTSFAQRVSMNYHLKKFHGEAKPRKIKKPRKQKAKKNKPAKTQSQKGGSV